MIFLERMANGQEFFDWVNACVQDFVWDPSFTQRCRFSDTDVAILTDAVVAANSDVVSKQ